MFAKQYMQEPGGVVIALQVEDVGKVCNELKEKGIEVFEGPKKTSWGQTVTYLHDPDGHIIELTS